MGPFTSGGVKGPELTIYEGKFVVSNQVLWTGGWDSTFRVIDLSLLQRKQVQPWYIAELGWPHV